MWERIFTRKRKPSVESEAIAKLYEQAAEQHQALGEQVSKLTRLVYRSNQETQSKIDALAEAIGKNQRMEQEYVLKRTENERLLRTVNQATDVLIRLLDDMDAALERMDPHERNGWSPWFTQWGAELLRQLEQMQVYELSVIGELFRPDLCEAAGTVSSAEADSSAAPYTVVQVIRRGFRYENGELLRKAQVVTLEGK